MNFGVQNNFSNTNNTYIEPDNTKTNFKANDTYVYGQIIGKLKKVSYTVGTGLKMFTMQDDTKGRTYYNNQSIIRLLYSPVKKFTIDFLSMYEPRLPNLSQLDNIVQTSNDILKKSGNPDLKPYNYFRNRITLKYTYDKVWTRLWAIYDYEMNPIITTTTYNGSYFLSKPINSNYSSKLNLQYDLGVERLWNHLDLRGSIIWNKYISDNDNFHHTLSNIKLDFQATVYLGKWTISGSYNPLSSKVLIGEEINTASPKYWVEVQYNWNNLYFSISGSSLFEKHGQRFSFESLSKVNPGISSMYIKDNASWITLGVVYRLNFGRKFNKSSKSLNNVDTEGSAITIK